MSNDSGRETRYLKFTIALKPMPSPRPRVTRRGFDYMPPPYTRWKADFNKLFP